MAARVLMIALDGADSRLLDRWTADGTLPAMARLRSRGTARHIPAPLGITDDGLWATFQYAAGLGEHGRYHWRQRLRTGRMGMSHLDETGRPRFWDRLSDAGRRVAVFDAPKCAAPRPINGIHLADWEVHGRYFPAPLSFPPELAGEVVARFGAALPSSCAEDHPALADDEARQLLGHLERSIAQKQAAALHYLGQENWDLFLVGFKEAHCAGHALWDIVDDRRPGYDAVRDEALGRPLRRIMTSLDAAVGALLDRAGPEAEIVVFSTTEFVPNGSLAHLMPGLVERLNAHLDAGVLSRLRRRLGGRAAIRLLPYNENCAALRVKGRRRDAIIADAHAMLAELTDANTGLPVIDGIDRPSATEPGARAAQLPDLLIRYRPGAMPAAVTSSRLGRVAAEPPVFRPGNHAPGLFTIAAGRRAGEGPSRLEDFGPFAERLLG